MKRTIQEEQNRIIRMMRTINEQYWDDDRGDAEDFERESLRNDNEGEEDYENWDQIQRDNPDLIQQQASKDWPFHNRLQGMINNEKDMSIEEIISVLEDIVKNLKERGEPGGGSVQHGTGSSFPSDGY